MTRLDEIKARVRLTTYGPLASEDVPYLASRVERLEEALLAAASSLEALSRSGTKDFDETLRDMSNVRAYATNRAKVARAALEEHE